MIANRLLVVDDQPKSGDLSRLVAESCGYETLVVVDAPTCRRALESFRPTVILLDVAQANADGVDVIGHLARTGCNAQILITGGPSDAVRAAQRSGEERGLAMAGRIAKPLNIEQLRAVLLRLRLAQRH